MSSKSILSASFFFIIFVSATQSALHKLDGDDFGINGGGPGSPDGGGIAGFPGGVVPGFPGGEVPGFGFPGVGIPGFPGGGDPGFSTDGFSKGGVVRPTITCRDKGPCYGKKLRCPAKCFHSSSHSGKGYGGGGGGGGCTIDCKKKCRAYC